MSNVLNPGQDRHSVSPDLGPNCLQRLSADIQGSNRHEKYLNIQYCLEKSFKIKFA